MRVMKRCTQIAREHGVQLLVEPRVGELTSNSEALLRLLEAVDDDNLGVILDTAHQHAQKEMLPLSVEKLGRHIRYVHVADNDGLVNRHFVPGTGTIDWEEVFRALKRQGFDGYYAVDLEQLPDLEQCFVRGQAVPGSLCGETGLVAQAARRGSAAGRRRREVRHGIKQSDEQPSTRRLSAADIQTISPRRKGQ